MSRQEFQIKGLRNPNGREVWAKWDESAELYELFASSTGEDYIGCADTREEAQAAAQAWIDDCNAEGI
jgi:hypothetical protein